MHIDCHLLIYVPSHHELSTKLFTLFLKVEAIYENIWVVHPFIVPSFYWFTFLILFTCTNFPIFRGSSYDTVASVMPITVVWERDDINSRCALEFKSILIETICIVIFKCKMIMLAAKILWKQLFYFFPTLFFNVIYENLTWKLTLATLLHGCLSKCYIPMDRILI